LDFDDFFLSTLLKMVEKGARTSITISVRGTVIEGDMISEREFFEETAAKITSDNPEHEEWARDLFGSLPAYMDEAAMSTFDVGEDPETMREFRETVASSFIHLKNVRVFQAGDFHEVSGATCRFRVSSVDGFWLGRYR